MENNKGINVLSCFDGMSCGRVALERAGIKVDNYFSSEIDKYAIQIANKNYPQDEVNRLGDVTKWQDWNIDWSSIDLVTGGFPCQAWSVAGKQLGDRDERGMLFWTMLDIMKKVLEYNPKAKFLIENVKMKKEFEEYITLHTSNSLGVVCKHLINSALVSAQNRQRYYWTNIEKIEQPKDKGILLKDILEDNISNLDKFKLSDEAINYMSRLRNGKPRWEYHINPLDGKAACLTANMYKGVPYGVIKELYRKLTPLECERLQTLPDSYTDGVSNSQRYKMLGNGWTVDVISHILKGLKN